ncbi:MAG: hypothetical protein GY801_01290, partial [bacterium]|nr:hypothetical protein [bacterium]
MLNYGNYSKCFSYSYYATCLRATHRQNGREAQLHGPGRPVCEQNRIGVRPYEYSYGANNELREVTIPGVGAITIADYQWNRPTRVLYPGGGRRELEYDGLMRLKHLSATDPGGNSLLDYSYCYDNSGNIVSKNTEHGEYSYGYDSASRLTSADNPTLDDESDSYDAVGNRTSASHAEGEIAHNANNELTIYGHLEYEYDANGNMTSVTLSGQPVFVYHYNADNRLVKVEGGNSNTRAEYYYDPFGRRLWKDVAGT